MRELACIAVEVRASTSGGRWPHGAHYRWEGPPQEVSEGWTEKAPEVLAGDGGSP